MRCRASAILVIGYDDSWTGLREILNPDPYEITTAPWYDAARPGERRVRGGGLMEAGGIDTVPVQREVADAICAGGAASSRGQLAHVHVLRAGGGVHERRCPVWPELAGAGQLRRANVTGGVVMDYWKAQPGGHGRDKESLRRVRDGSC